MLKSLKKHKKPKGQSFLEYVLLIVFIIAALLVFQKYISRAIWGRYKSVGDALGSGLIYDPEKTLECGYDHLYGSGWYNAACYDENDCAQYCAAKKQAPCVSCIGACFAAKCSEN
ncbi:MAG: hypothetical protein P9X22_09315 [Candidatus Zapsychrus exili]|nr:hypothetical protein [Candidatus Zapsychrus exili]